MRAQSGSRTCTAWALSLSVSSPVCPDWPPDGSACTPLGVYPSFETWLLLQRHVLYTCARWFAVFRISRLTQRRVIVRGADGGQRQGYALHEVQVVHLYMLSTAAAKVANVLIRRDWSEDTGAWIQAELPKRATRWVRRLFRRRETGPPRATTHGSSEHPCDSNALQRH